MNAFQQFKNLHQQETPLLIGNVWDGLSAKTLEALKFQALATSSAAVAETLGYADGENMSFDEYLFMVKRIQASTSLPLSVDLEGGYGKTVEAIVSNIKKLHEAGVVGMNIEDSFIQNKTRLIEQPEKFADKLKGISQKLQSEKIDLFINVRCDAFLLGLPDARKEAINRIKLYEATGASGIFLPCITDKEDIKACVSATKLPVNVMCMPELPDFNFLKEAGVKRISIGNFAHQYIYKNLEKVVGQIQEEKSFASLFR